jgi:hypothetical protein
MSGHLTCPVVVVWRPAIAGLLFATVVAVAVVGAGCLGALGERCASTDACQTNLECVLLEDGKSYCLPRPAERAERTCSEGDGCSAAREPLLPVEAECVDGVCRCALSAFDCIEIDGELVDPSELVVDPVTCLCRRRAASDEQ